MAGSVLTLSGCGTDNVESESIIESSALESSELSSEIITKADDYSKVELDNLIESRNNIADAVGMPRR